MLLKPLALSLLFAAAPAFADATLARNLAAQCANCHGAKDAPVPALNGQPAAHIIEQMAAFKSGKRTATIMHQLAKGYSDEQIKLMAEHFAQQK
jgi:cytochrome subunit of sulfide dehydrogenase